jgi:hypothetical protein
MRRCDLPLPWRAVFQRHVALPLLARCSFRTASNRRASATAAPTSERDNRDTHTQGRRPKARTFACRQRVRAAGRQDSCRRAAPDRAAIQKLAGSQTWLDLVYPHGKREARFCHLAAWPPIGYRNCPVLLFVIRTELFVLRLFEEVAWVRRRRVRGEGSSGARNVACGRRFAIARSNRLVVSSR